MRSYIHACAQYRRCKASSLHQTHMDIPLLSLASNAAPPCRASAIRFREIVLPLRFKIINLGKERKEGKSKG